MGGGASKPKSRLPLKSQIRREYARATGMRPQAWELEPAPWDPPEDPKYAHEAAESDDEDAVEDFELGED
eukprot:443224-Pyramimonas_sp.AAC.1